MTEEVMVVWRMQSEREDEESEAGSGEVWRGVVREVVCQRKEDSLNRRRRVCAVIWAPNLVSKGGGGNKSIGFLC